MNGNLKREWWRHRAVWFVALASLAFAPLARADHDDDWDDYDDDGYYYEDDDYYDDDDDRYYDRDRRDGRSGWDWRFGAVFGSRWGWGCDSPAVVAEFPSLRGHGEWRWVRSARDWVWFPYVERSWRPYYYGHWVHTHYGMTWVSYEPWGEIPHHYGNWVYLDHYGWGWIPGYDYAPAHVTFGVCDGSIGWAPLPPAGWRYHGHGSHYRINGRPVTYGFRGEFGYHPSNLSFDFWVFVSNDHFYGSSVYRYAQTNRKTLSLFKNKRVLPVGRSLNVDYVRQVSPTKVKSVKVDRRTRTFGDRKVTFQEPRGQADRILKARDATRKVVKAPPADTRRDDRITSDKRRFTADRDKAAVDKRSSSSGREKVAEKKRSSSSDRDKVAEKKRSSSSDREKVAKKSERSSSKSKVRGH